MPSSSLPSYAHGVVAVALALADRVVLACDRTAAAASVGAPSPAPRIFEVGPRLVVAGAGLWATAGEVLDVRRDVLAAFRRDDTAESLLRRYDRLYRSTFERFLTERFRLDPESVLRQCFCPLTPPHSLIVGNLSREGPRLTVFEYIPALNDQDRIVLTPLIQHAPRGVAPVYMAIGPAAPYVADVDPDEVTKALRSPERAEEMAALLVNKALEHAPTIEGAPVVRTVPIRPTPAATPRAVTNPRGAKAARVAKPFPPADTRDVEAVQRFVQERFDAMFPDTPLAWVPIIFRDIESAFRGDDPAYAALDLKYHDFEHTLQAVVCATSLLHGRHLARATPRIDAHHFELAIAATLLHDSGYLRLRTDTFGTGAKYTFCHVVRSCAFAASYLPRIGATAHDVEIVLAAINCTGPTNEISRLRFPAAVDEVIGCIVATADYLGQMAAVDYADELDILFHEFSESDDFLRLPQELRLFKSAQDLIARTPHFWHRIVLPKLDTDFRGVYRFLADPYPTGRNAYLDAVNANIARIQYRLAERREAGHTDVPQVVNYPAVPPAPRAAAPANPVGSKL